MSWTERWNAVLADVRRRGLPADALETLAREIPLKETDEARAVVGGVLESQLRERYVTELTGAPTATILAECAAAPELYGSRVDRARSDARARVLEARFPDMPDPIDTYDENAGLTYGQHIAKHYAP